MLIKGKIIKVRFVKNYASAHNHVVIGRVVDESDCYLLLECRTLHFGTLVRNRSRIEHGAKALRALPWHRIEVLHVLDDEVDWASDLTIDDDGYVSTKGNRPERLLRLIGRNPPQGAMMRRTSIYEAEEATKS